MCVNGTMYINVIPPSPALLASLLSPTPFIIRGYGRRTDSPGKVIEMAGGEEEGEKRTSH